MATDRTTSPTYAARSYDHPNDGDLHIGGGEDAQSPLLGGPRKDIDEEELEGTASSLSGIGNLLNTIVGTGMLVSWPQEDRSCIDTDVLVFIPQDISFGG